MHALIPEVVMQGNYTNSTNDERNNLHIVELLINSAWKFVNKSNNITGNKVGIFVDEKAGKSQVQ